MENKFVIYNTLTRKKEIFEPINPPHVGLYVCGPTVYGVTHLGHARPAVAFDILFRYLQHLGYKVRYVRNITDVGHLENDADFGEDKIAKKARLEQLEPMEIVQHYSNLYHENMQKLNTLPPSIEPRASAHIIEQQKMVDDIFNNGFAYKSNGSVYFDVEKYNKKFNYGKLSGRNIDELKSSTRELDGQNEKHNPFDFALWKEASPEHIMHWPSKWSEGFPGWHLECSVMSTKYLGEEFDIHGGGLDLLFPHHECEIAQTTIANGHESVKYWMHNNMVTINGQKMGKSLGNSISLDDFFQGNHKLLEKPYSPMTIRFFMLQAHYRSTVDFSNEALQSAEKGMSRLMNSVESIKKITPSDNSSIDINSIEKKCYDAMNDDLNTPVLIAVLFDAVRVINLLLKGKEQISKTDLEKLTSLLNTFIFDILGLKRTEVKNSNDDILNNVVDLLLNVRMEVKNKKDFATSDRIRDELTNLGFIIKDKKEGFEWEFKK